MRRSLLALALCAALIAPAAAQSRKKRAAAASTPAPDSYPITSLAVRGNNIYTAAQILGVAGLKTGDAVTPADLEAARQRLLATGAFQRAGFEYKIGHDGYDTTFEVTEDTQFYGVSFEDLPATSAELSQCLHDKDPLFGPKIAATEMSLDRYTALVEQCVAPRGFTGHVKATLTDDYSPDLTILFRPSTPRPTVAEVYFTNTGEIIPAALQTAISGAAIGLSYTEQRFRTILDTTIRPMYEAKGYLRAAFPSIATAPSKNVKGLAITVKVVPGDVYKLTSLRVSGAEDIPPLAKVKPGDVANFDVVKAAQERLDQILHNRGYLHETTQVFRSLDDANHTVAVTLRATPGPQFLTGKLQIVGLDVIAEPAIRKVWGLPAGQPFNASYPDHFLKVIRDEGLFDNLGATKSETKIHEDTRTVDVTLRFEGPKRKKDWETHPTGEDPVQPDLGIPFPPYPP